MLGCGREPRTGSLAALGMTRRHHHPAFFFTARFSSLSASIAAFRPLTPITLPPGWVPAPQSNTPGIGVRAAQPAVPHVLRQDLALEDVPAGQADPLLDVGRPQDLHPGHRRRNVAAEAADGPHDDLTHLLATAVPVALAETRGERTGRTRSACEPRPGRRCGRTPCAGRARSRSSAEARPRSPARWYVAPLLLLSGVLACPVWCGWRGPGRAREVRQLGSAC